MLVRYDFDEASCEISILADQEIFKVKLFELLREYGIECCAGLRCHIFHGDISHIQLEYLAVEVQEFTGLCLYLLIVLEGHTNHVQILNLDAYLIVDILYLNVYRSFQRVLTCYDI